MSNPLLGNWRALLLLAVLAGGAVASFLNVVAWRLPLGRSLSHPPSACPHCGHPIRPWHNVPVLGWLVLGGRCHDCKEPISARYPLVEALGGLLFGVIFLRLVPSPEALDRPGVLLEFGAYAGYFAALLAISLVDLDHFIVPDSISLPLIPLGIAVVALLDAAGLGSVSLPASVFGALAGGGILLALAGIGRLAYGREALGMGDVKLLAAIGAWQGLHPTLLFTVFGASALGSVVGIAQIARHGRNPQAKLPFGPFLCGAALITFLWGEAIRTKLWGGMGL